MQAVLVERFRVLGGLLVLGLEQLAGIGEGPAVEGTGEAALVAVLAPAQHGALVRAGVDHRVQGAGLVAGDHHRLAADPGGVVVIGIGQLALVAQVHPVALEDVLHLQLEQLGVGEDVAAAAVQAGLLVIHQGGGQQLLESFGAFDDGGHGSVSGMRWRHSAPAVGWRLGNGPGGRRTRSARPPRPAMLRRARAGARPSARPCRGADRSVPG